MEDIFKLKFGETHKFYLPKTENKLKRIYLVKEFNEIDLSFKGKQDEKNHLRVLGNHLKRLINEVIPKKCGVLLIF